MIFNTFMCIFSKYGYFSKLISVTRYAFFYVQECVSTCSYKSRLFCRHNVRKWYHDYIIEVLVLLKLHISMSYPFRPFVSRFIFCSLTDLYISESLITTHFFMCLLWIICIKCNNTIMNNLQCRIHVHCTDNIWF